MSIVESFESIELTTLDLHYIEELDISVHDAANGVDADASFNCGDVVVSFVD